MAKKAKDFVVSTADFAMYYNDILACTGTTNLDTSIEVSMEEQTVNAGKGNKKVYSYKYGRELNVTLQAADWRLEYLALSVGTDIAVKLADMYKIGECLSITEGTGVLPKTPIGDVAVELADGSIVTVTPEGSTIDVKKYGVTDGTVNVTYKFSNMAKEIIIDAETSPKVYKLILDADKHNNKVGKVGSVQIEIPSYQPNGNFTMDFTPDGVASSNIDGSALAVDGEKCEDGNAVYAYVREFDDNPSEKITVAEIAATPAKITLSAAAKETTETISVIGIKGVMYSTIELDNKDCTFVDGDSGQYATVDTDGVVTPVAEGNTKITVTYNGVTDEVDVEVTA